MTGAATPIDAASVEILLNELRLPGVKAIWPKIAAQSAKEEWPAAHFLATLAEHESVDRTRRRIERHPTEARLLAGKIARHVLLRERADGVESADNSARVGRRLAHH